MKVSSNWERVGFEPRPRTLQCQVACPDHCPACLGAPENTSSSVVTISVFVTVVLTEVKILMMYSTIKREQSPRLYHEGAALFHTQIEVKLEIKRLPAKRLDH